MGKKMKRDETQYSRKKNEARKYCEDKIKRERRRHLKRVMPHHIATSPCQCALDSAELHCPKLGLCQRLRNTRKIVEDRAGAQHRDFDSFLLRSDDSSIPPTATLLIPRKELPFT